MEDKFGDLQVKRHMDIFQIVVKSYTSIEKLENAGKKKKKIGAVYVLCLPQCLFWYWGCQS